MSKRLGHSWWAAGLMVLAMSQAAGQASSQEAASRPAAAATSAPADGSHEAEAFVRRLIRDPRILMRPWPSRAKVFPSGCHKAADVRTLECPPLAGIVQISTFGAERGVISVRFKPPMTCERLHALVRRHLGPPTRLEPDDPCDGYWELDRWRVPGSLVVSRRLHQDGEVLLQMGAEQGP